MVGICVAPQASLVRPYRCPQTAAGSVALAQCRHHQKWNHAEQHADQRERQHRIVVAESVLGLKVNSRRKACLLANHGLIAAGRDLDEAMAVAIEIESLCGQYLIARQSGKPVLLSADEMQAVIERFRSYGRNANPA